MTTPSPLDQEWSVPERRSRAALFMTRVLSGRLDPWREIR